MSIALWGLLALCGVCMSGPVVAPDQFCVQFQCTTGGGSATPSLILNITRSLSPHGVDRFYDLVHSKYYDENGFFRVVPNFVVQFGINGNPVTSAQWKDKTIPDDPVVGSNTAGTIAFATAGPNTRTTQLFINTADNSRLDKMGFSPFGSVLGDGLTKVVDQINSQYGQHPDQNAIYQEGNQYLKEKFPKLDYLTAATVVKCP